MTNPVAQMARLMQITESAYAVEQANMTRLNRREAELRQQIADLNAARIGVATPLEEDHAARVGADFLWQKWVDSRVTALNTDLARVLVEKARAHAKLTRAFGKYQVTGHLYEQARIARRKAADKREERGG